MKIRGCCQDLGEVVDFPYQEGRSRPQNNTPNAIELKSQVDTDENRQGICTYPMTYELGFQILPKQTGPAGQKQVIDPQLNASPKKHNHSPRHKHQRCANEG